MTTRVDYGGPGPGQVRLVGDYILGPKIGSGSFAVVWRSRHRQHGLEVAVKEIDKKLLSSKVSESLLKEISILSTINHPNIIQLFEAIETEDRIFLVLEYCDGGDLAAYIQRYGKVSEEVARHLMRQLAAGLQVLQEKHLIHRDLKPQNLLLTKGPTPQLKIGDFGFARSLTPENLADTLCGSPLYMAPEIIQNKKYDAKADLWSVGAILFQLVTGKPPFDGNNQLQLFQNILRSTELQFPEGALEELHPDCVNLCRSLLRHDPVERLTFREFFDHKFLDERSKKVGLELNSSRLQSEAMVEQFDSSASEKKSPLPYRDLIDISSINQKSVSSFGCGTISQTKEYECSPSVKGALGAVALTVCDSKGKSVDNQCSPAQLRVADSLEGIEKDYVLVNSHSASMETFSYYLETSLQDYSTLKCQAKKSDQEPAVSLEKETAESSAASAKSPQFQGSDMQTSSESAMLREVQRLNILHPSTRLQLLHQYARAIAEIAQGKYNAGLFVESFSVELVVLAIWKKALQICSSWKSSAPDNESPRSNPGSQPTTTIQSSADLPPNSGDSVDLNKPSSACIWAEQGFIVAYDRAEKLSCHLQDMDATAQMPDAMEIIYQTALTIGTSGAVDEYMRNKGSAAALYSKAMVLLSFIVGEAASLPLNPPFTLTPANKMRIQTYINNLQTHQSQFLTSAPFPKLSADFHTK
ncbi:serine/threonine-protein kinase ATG1a-like isoform X1 [Gossypium australe]|uniref:Serine/threonine-protein kinase ATG1a-like isoform X1 n=1 Tax=Gossypium australe TaxID=47621 RepID=A0A5B6W1H8_9ROSI|nr:serine/threonine-protein kinase ATG1a-like isoform X1 [Gossypium australe]